MNDQTMSTEPDTILVQTVMDKEPKEIKIASSPIETLQGQVNYLVLIDEKIKYLYDQKKQVMKDLIGSNPSFTFIQNVGGDKPWRRVVITDSLIALKEDETLHRVATFNRYEAKIDLLKNQPKE